MLKKILAATVAVAILGAVPAYAQSTQPTTTTKTTPAAGKMKPMKMAGKTKHHKKPKPKTPMKSNMMKTPTPPKTNG